MNTITCHNCDATLFPWGDEDQVRQAEAHRQGVCDACDECGGMVWEAHCENCGPLA